MLSLAKPWTFTYLQNKTTIVKIIAGTKIMFSFFSAWNPFLKIKKHNKKTTDNRNKVNTLFLKTISLFTPANIAEEKIDVIIRLIIDKILLFLLLFLLKFSKNPINPQKIKKEIIIPKNDQTPNLE